MEREQFKVLVKAMKAVYAQPTFIPDQDAFNVWFALLGDLPYKQAELAVQKHMATEKFPPTIADIREKAEQITSVKETEMSELEAWAIVRKAIGRSNYYAEEEFEKLRNRAESKFTGGYGYGRGYFFCENQETKRLPREAFGNQMPSFIGFGTPEYETKLTVKTSPRWCPRRKKKE